MATSWPAIKKILVMSIIETNYYIHDRVKVWTSAVALLFYNVMDPTKSWLAESELLKARGNNKIEVYSGLNFGQGKLIGGMEVEVSLQESGNLVMELVISKEANA